VRILVAGCGNIFLGDDGFGSAVARRLAAEHLPPEVSVTDFGVRGVHLAYELTAGYATAILVDAVPRGGAPGTLYVLEPHVLEPHVLEPDVTQSHVTGPGAAAESQAAGPSGRPPVTGAGDVTFVDAHDMTPETVLALAGVLDAAWTGAADGADRADGSVGRVLLVGCEPADTSPGMELSPPVAAAVRGAADLVLELVQEELAAASAVADPPERR
jgi:hydrogenase maturation protease